MDFFFSPAEDSILSSDVAWDAATLTLKGKPHERNPCPNFDGFIFERLFL